jgi:uncharacterized protein (TIGR03437 family)
MNKMPILARFVCPLLVLAGTASAQVTIGAVVNAGSRIQNTSQFYGIAQGALFAITGKGLGPDPLQQATFPLPTTDGLGGVTVQASVGGATVDCILVYVSSTEVGAILPSMTPLGTGTVTINNNGVTATKAITVVAAAFGMFTSTQEGYAGRAMAFNVSAADGSTAPNTTSQSVQPGQDVLLNGTGLGAITSDETQSGVADVPATTVQVYVGVVPAVVVSAGRGLCCDGLDPSFPVPQGIAAWDVIRFTIPAGVTGCFIPVVVQIGNMVSNLATLSIDPSGAACALIPSILPAALTQQLTGKPNVKFGSIALSRGTGMAVNANKGNAINTTKQDTGSAAFIGENIPASMITAEATFPVNACTINMFPDPNGNIVHNGTVVAVPPPIASVSLDAGATLTVSGPSGKRTIVGIPVPGTSGPYYKGVTFGNSTPGNFYDPGHYTVTGTGGKDVGAFTGSIDVPSTPFVWTNIPSLLTPLDRSKDLTIKWMGGIPNTQVTAVGGSGTSAFLCAADVSAGQLTIPSYVLLNLPPSGPPLNSVQLTVGNRTVNLFTASGLDLAWVGYAEDYTVFLKYQ